MNPTTWHEGGHALVAVALGLPIIEAVASIEAEAGFVRLGNLEPSRLEKIAILLAGQIAQMTRPEANVEDVATFCGLDHHALAAMNPTPGEVEQAARLAEQVITANYTALIAIANALEAQGRLTGDEITTIFNAHKHPKGKQ